jgi:hypothetical protein
MSDTAAGFAERDYTVIAYRVKVIPSGIRDRKRKMGGMGLSWQKEVTCPRSPRLAAKLLEIPRLR